MDYSVKHKAKRFLEENKRENLWDLESGKEFLDILDMTPTACSIFKKSYFYNFIKIRYFSLFKIPLREG